MEKLEVGDGLRSPYGTNMITKINESKDKIWFDNERKSMELGLVNRMIEADIWEHVPLKRIKEKLSIWKKMK